MTSYLKNDIWLKYTHNFDINKWKVEFCLLNHDQNKVYLIGENAELPVKIKPYKKDHGGFVSERPKFKERYFLHTLNSVANGLVSEFTQNDAKWQGVVQKSIVINYNDIIAMEKEFNQEYNQAFQNFQKQNATDTGLEKTK